MSIASLKTKSAKKKVVVNTLTTERDALKEAAAKLLDMSPRASAKELKARTDLRRQVLQGVAREEVLRTQLEALSKLLAKGLSGNRPRQCRIYC